MRRSAALLVATAATAAVVAVAVPANAEPVTANNGDQVARTELSLDRANRPTRPYGTKAAEVNGQDVDAEDYLGTRFIPSAPRRILDTRSGLGRGGITTPVGAGGRIEVPVTDSPAYTLAVVLNVTGTSPTANTYVTVWEGGADVAKPGVSTLNLVPGETRANSVTTWISLDDTINLYNNAGSTHLIADIAGYYVYDNPNAGVTPGRYFATGPTRVYDSRNTGGAFGGGESRAVDFSSYGVPSGATAVSLNITGVDATANTYVTAWPSGSTRPTASSLNLVPNVATPNGVTVALGSDRKVNLFNHSGSVNLIVDIAGYYLPTETGGADFYPLTPGRAFDTRDDQDPIRSGGTLALIYPAEDLAAGDSLLLNLTGTEPTNHTFITPFPTGQTRPGTSALNLAPGQTSPNMATVRLGTWTDGSPAHSFYNNVGTTHLVVDVFGIFS